MMDRPPIKLSVIVFSGDYAKVHYALAAAAAAAAIERPATLFFTMEAARALSAGEDGMPGWHALAGSGEDLRMRARGIVGFEELLASCTELGVRFMACDMGLRAINLDPEELRSDVEVTVTGLVSFLTDAEAAGAVLFV